MRDEYQQLLQGISRQQPIWRRLANPANYRRLYRDDQGRLTGILVFSTNDLHPHALGMTAYTQDSTLYPRMLAAGRALARKQHQDRLVTWEFRPLDAWGEWLLTQGFAVWRETVEPHVALSAVTVPEYPKASLDLLTMAEVLARPRLKRALLTRSLRDYERVHAISPLAPTTVEQWADLCLPDELTAAPGVLLGPQGIRAYTFLFADRPHELTLAWQGATSPADLWRLQGAQITWARQHGMTQLAGEFDSTDPLALATARHWPFAPAPVYTMLGKRIG